MKRKARATLDQLEAVAERLESIAARIRRSLEQIDRMLRGKSPQKRKYLRRQGRKDKAPTQLVDAAERLIAQNNGDAPKQNKMTLYGPGDLLPHVVQVLQEAGEPMGPKAILAALREKKIGMRSKGNYIVGLSGVLRRRTDVVKKLGRGQYVPRDVEA